MPNNVAGLASFWKDLPPKWRGKILQQQSRFKHLER